MAKVLPFKGGAEGPADDEQAYCEDQTANTEFLSLMDKSVEDILREGQKALFARLVSTCRAGTATHQELAILRNILKDNGLTLGIPPETPAQPGPKLPLPSEDDIPEYGEPES